MAARPVYFLPAHIMWQPWSFSLFRVKLLHFAVIVGDGKGIP
jgi:hypothetical protein